MEVTLGRKGLLVPLDYEVVGELTLADLQAVVPTPGSSTPPLKRLHDRHHALARALAMGMSPADAGVTYGYAASTISILQTDPAFKALLDFYRKSEDAATMTVVEKFAGLASDAADLVHERLHNEETRAKINLPEALEIAKTFADRSGNGPQSSSVAVNINIGLAERLRSRREAAERAMKTINAVAAE